MRSVGGEVEIGWRSKVWGNGFGRKGGGGGGLAMDGSWGCLNKFSYITPLQKFINSGVVGGDKWKFNIIERKSRYPRGRFDSACFGGRVIIVINS